jgi:hypothetical protein
MSDIASDITSALQSAARAGALAASSGGRNLSDAIENYVVPNLRDIGINVADIIEKQQTGAYTADIAQTMLASECDAVKEVIETATTLAVIEVEQIYNAMMTALAGAVNKAAGVALL